MWKHDSDQCFQIHLLDIPGGLWLGAHLPTQGMVKEESTCHGATEPESRDYRSLRALSLCSATGEGAAARSPHVAAREQPPLAATTEKPDQQQRPSRVNHNYIKQTNKKDYIQGTKDLEGGIKDE